MTAPASNVVSLAAYVAARAQPAPTDLLASTIERLKPAPDWRTGMMEIELARALLDAADARRILHGWAHGKDERYEELRAETHRAQERHDRACLRQLFVPATALRFLRWKQAWAKRNHASKTPEIAAALAADEKAHARRIEGVKRQQATKLAKREAAR